jgi:hypothetical protein
MNKNFAFLTSVPQIPEMPDDLSREDEFCWIVYQMKELNLILQAYAAQQLLHVDKKEFVSYFYTVRDLLISLMRKERVDVSPSTMSSLKETLDELLVNLGRRN